MARILVVDDEPVVRNTYQLFLSTAGKHEVFTAEDWKHALPIIFKEKLDLLLIDVNLPFMKGDEFVKMLFKTLLDPPTTVLLSGIEEEQLRKKADSVGAQGFIHKRSSPVEIISRIEGMLKKQSGAE